MQFTLPRALLHQNKMHRRQMLDEYFPSGLIPFEEYEGNEWKITAFIPNDSSYYVDPLLEKVLQQWNEPVSIETLGSSRYIIKNALFSFYDSWSLYYWSLVISWLRSQERMPKQITLFHVDDHLDFASPHLISDINGYECIFSQQSVNFLDSSSIERAILNRSVGNASFIAPLLHFLDTVNVLHLRYAHKGQPCQYGIACTYDEDLLLANGKKRPSLKIESVEYTHSYTIASKSTYLLEKAKDSEVVFLHIDCDAFSNRYNLDTNWSPSRVSIDFNLDQMKKEISELLYAVSRLPARIFMNVALSPGFFPSEYWQEIREYIFVTAENLGIVKDDEFSSYLKGTDL